MKNLFQFKKIERFLTSGKLRELESWLQQKSKKNPELLLHLSLYYKETNKPIEAVDCAERFTLYLDSPLSRYIYYEMLSIFQPRRLEEEKRLLRKKLNSNDKNFILFCLALIDLFTKHTNLAKGRFTKCIQNGYPLGYWGIARLSDSPEEALEYLNKVKKLANTFPIIWKDLGMCHLQMERKFSSLSYLSKYLKKIPLDTDIQYEFAMTLLEHSHIPVIGRWIVRKAVKSLMIKAILNPAKSENLWIYRFLALYLASKGNFYLAAKWILVEKNVLYQLFNVINSKIASLNKIPQEEIIDMLNSIREILSEKDIIDPEEFAKTYARIRETRLLEEMLRLSEEKDEQGDKNKVD